MAAWPGECLGDGAEQRSVIIGERWPIVLAAKHSELVSQDGDLDVFGAAGPRGEAGQRRQEAVQVAIYTPQDRSVSALVNAPVRVSGTHTLKFLFVITDNPSRTTAPSRGLVKDHPGYTEPASLPAGQPKGASFHYLSTSMALG